MLQLADSIPSDMEFALEARDRNTRDILGHIAAWHQMMLRWHTAGIEGAPTPVPSVSHTWDEITELNQTIWRVVQEMTYDHTREACVRTHQACLTILDNSSEEQFWGAGVYGWTRSGTVGSWFRTLTASHYEWGIAKMRRAIRVAQAGHGPALSGQAEQFARVGLDTLE
jgi:hypothetical protein